MILCDISNQSIISLVTVLYPPIYRLTERKTKHFHVRNCPCGTVGAKMGYMLGLLLHGKVVVDFGRKVFLFLLKTCFTESYTYGFTELEKNCSMME